MTKTPTKARKPSVQLLSNAKIVEPPLPAKIEHEAEAESVTLQKPKRWFSIGKLFWTAVTGLAGLAFSLWLDALIADLFLRAEWLGYVGIAMVVFLVLALLALIMREAKALSRLKTMNHLQKRATKAYRSDDLSEARRTVNELLVLYGGQPETARGRKLLQNQLNEIMDGKDLFLLAERDLLADMDSQASKLILSSSKRTSIVTAISPRALIDVLFVVVENLRLIRRLSQLYGGHPGLFSSWRLTTAVISHLVVTGGISAGDNLLQDALGHGLAAKVSTRLGEGVINGMLTARVGRAAMMVCRPLPFLANKPPSLKSIFGELTKSATSKQTDDKQNIPE